MSSVANLENHMVLGNTDAHEYTADELAARANRYEIALQRLENVGLIGLIAQSIDALENGDAYRQGFTLFFHDAVKRRDEALVGKLFMRVLEMHRHHLVEEELDE